MTTRTGLAALFAAAAVTLAAAGFLYEPATPTPPGEIFRVDSDACELGTVPAGVHYRTLTVTNTDTVPRRLIGFTEHCYRNACVELDGPASAAVAPGATHEIRLKVTVHGPGPFLCPFCVFLEDRSVREVALQITGTAE